MSLALSVDQICKRFLGLKILAEVKVELTEAHLSGVRINVVLIERMPQSPRAQSLKLHYGY